MAAKLLVRSSGPAELDAARAGGLPAVPADFEWPRCRTCNGPMQFLAQMPLASSGPTSLGTRDQLLLVFQCQNQPGLCDEWEPEAGGNAALLVPRADLILGAQPSGVASLPREDPLELRPYDDSRQDVSPDDNYCEALDADSERVVGKAGGAPLWLQADETPLCGGCGRKMEFVFLVESHAAGGINFGDSGVGYAFVCASCTGTARFLFQCA